MIRSFPLVALLAACKINDPTPVTSSWYDGFERLSLGANYKVTGDGYRVDAGQLSARGAHNHPLWLRKKLPRNVRIELDAWSNEPRGDIKVELFGDGRSYDPDGGAYKATGYELIFGGWHNSKSMIAKLDEHGTEMAQRTDVKVIPKKHYHWRIERQPTPGLAPGSGSGSTTTTAATVKWFIDDMAKPFLEYVDNQPLENAGHEYFAFNNWEADTWFDNLVITPL